MKNTKTSLQQTETLNFLKANFIGKTFHSKVIYDKFPNIPAAPIFLSHLVELGYAKRVKQGLYQLNHNINDLNVIENVRKLTNEKSRIHNNKRSQQLNDAKNKLQKPLIDISIPKIEPISCIKDYTDNELIIELKLRGYKIMKPISQYEEV